MITSYKTVFTKKKQLTKDVFLFRFQLLEPKEINFKAGQYLILLIPIKGTDPVNGALRRLYSIASADFQKEAFELLVKIVEGGVGSNYLSNLNLGQVVIFQGPAGLFFLHEGLRPKIFLATGTGLAPLRSILISNIKNQKSKMQLNNKKFYLFWGLKTFQDTYLLDELKQLSKESEEQFKFKICLSRQQDFSIIPKEDKGYFTSGYIQDGLKSFIIDQKHLFSEKADFKNFDLDYSNFDYYLCGNREVVESLRCFLGERGVPDNQVFFEKF